MKCYVKTTGRTALDIGFKLLISALKPGEASVEHRVLLLNPNICSWEKQASF